MNIAIRAVATLFLGAAILSGPAAAQSVGAVVLPAQITHPEGVAYDAASGVIYTASAETGAVARTDLRSGASTIIAQAGVVLPTGENPFPAALGLKIDGDRLWIAGGRTAKVTVLNVKSGAVLASSATGDAGSLLNDLVVTRDGAYVTDTLRPMVWRAPINNGAIGKLEPWLSLANTPIVYSGDAGLNGVTLTPDGKSLIVVQMAKGLLFRIDIASKAITPIDLGGEIVAGGDGLWINGTTLYVVRQPAQEIVTVALSSDLKSGKVVSRYTNPALLWPATSALVGDGLLVVNSQFNNRGTPQVKTPFTVARIPLSSLQAK